MRCLVLADAFAARGFEPIFYTAPETLSGVPALGRSGHRVEPAEGSSPDEAALAAMGAARFAALVFDRYGRPAAEVAAFRLRADVFVSFADAGLPPMQDGPDPRWIEVAADRGGDPSDRIRLEGPDFALVRPDILARRAAAERKDRREPIRRILVFFGMADRANGCGAALEVLSTVDADISIDVVVGSISPHAGAVRDIASKDPRVRVLVAPVDFDDVTAAADLAIGAGGVSAFERACLGLPAIAYAAADNQAEGLDLLARAGALLHGGVLTDLPATLPVLLRTVLGDPDLRSELSRAGRRTVDGGGAERVVRAVEGALPA